MRTIRLRYVQEKLQQKLNVKTLLLTFMATVVLSACGIKGDLYQTPEQAVIKVEATEVDTNKELETKSNIRQQLEEQPEVEPTIEPAKSLKNVS